MSSSDPMPVWGWTTMTRLGQVRKIVAARSIAAAARISGDTPYFIRTYGAQTANPTELEVAHACPGVVLYRPLDDLRAPFAPMEGVV